MKSLIHRLLMMKVRPYYLYQCDLIKGSSHLRTDVKVGLDIIKNLRGHTTGYAIPQFVIDTPGGGGKVPISPDTAKFNEDGSIKLLNYSNKEILYPSLKEELSILLINLICAYRHYYTKYTRVSFFCIYFEYTRTHIISKLKRYLIRLYCS